MKRTVSILIATFCFFSVFAAESRLEVGLSPISTQCTIGSDGVSMLSDKGAGLSFCFSQRESNAIVGFGIDVDVFAFDGASEAPAFDSDASVYAKVGLAFGRRIQTSVSLCSGFKSRPREKAFVPALGIEGKLLAAPTRNLAIGLCSMLDLTTLESKEVWTLSNSIVLSWRI